MKSRLSLLCWSACIGLIFLAASSARAQIDLGPATATGSAELGGYPQSLPAADSAKLQQYRDLEQQVIVPELKLFLGGKEQQYYANFDLLNVGQTNEMYSARFGKYGVLDVQAEWKEIPHFFSRDVAETPYVNNGGVFTLLARPSGPNDVQRFAAQDVRPLTLDLLEGVANLNIRYTPTPEWTITANYNFQNPTGDRAFGSLFGPSPGEYNIAEIYEPIQYYTYNYGVGVQYAKNGYFLGAQYQGSFFRNANTTITWQNPDTWNNPTVNGQCVSEAEEPSGGGAGPCVGRADTYPDNQAHTFSVTGGATLPFNTHLMANASYGFWLQNDEFIPYTINNADIPSTSIPMSQVPLPRGSLHGDVRPFFVNATIVSNPIEPLPLELRGTYTYYDYANDTPAMRFVNAPALNDAYAPWTATAFPFGFSTQDIKGTVGYTFYKKMTLHFVTDINTQHNQGLEVLQQNTTSYGPVLDWNPASWLGFRGSYQHAFRSAPGYDNNRQTLVEQNAGTFPELDEVAALRRFYDASFHLDQFSLQAQTQPLKNLTLATDFEYDEYNYGSSNLGLQHTSSYSPSVSATYDPIPGIHLFGTFGWQAYDWNLKSFHRQPIFGAPIPSEPNCPTGSDASGQTPETCPAQVWTSNGRDQGSSVEIGLDVAIPPDPFLGHTSRLKIDYTYTVGTSMIHAGGDTARTNPPLGATNYPDIGSQFHELIVQYAYELTKNATFKCGYFYSHYGFNSFQIDNQVRWLSTSPQSIFLGDSTEIPYTANMGFIALKYEF
jgi:MtrB/PioB family decaheme-associated outer membrane protein